MDMDELVNDIINFLRKEESFSTWFANIPYTEEIKFQEGLATVIQARLNKSTSLPKEERTNWTSTTLRIADLDLDLLVTNLFRSLCENSHFKFYFDTVSSGQRDDLEKLATKSLFSSLADQFQDLRSRA